MNFDQHSEIVKELQSEFGEGCILVDASTEIQPYIEIKSDDLLKVSRFLKESPKLYFDFLNTISAVDNGPQVGSLEVWYHVTSIVFEKSFVYKVTLDRNQVEEKLPSLNSLTDIWKTADWHEREVFDLFGIHFEGHPDLRRILLPADWEGFPMRKDYIDQEKYHGVNIKYDR